MRPAPYCTSTHVRAGGGLRHQPWMIDDRLLPTLAEGQYSMACEAGKAGVRNKLTQQNHPMTRGNGYNNPTSLRLSGHHPEVLWGE
jgi:hypothetical protein